MKAIQPNYSPAVDAIDAKTIEYGSMKDWSYTIGYLETVGKREERRITQ